METLWDNVAKLNYLKGEENIRDQIEKALALVNQGKMTEQQFKDRMTIISQGKQTNKTDYKSI